MYTFIQINSMIVLKGPERSKVKFREMQELIDYVIKHKIELSNKNKLPTYYKNQL